MSGGQGARLGHIPALGGDTRRISKAIGHLREHFDEQLKMEDIARELVNPRSDAESWQIQVVFGYVFDPAQADIVELLACKDTSYSFPCLGKLNDIAKILAVGNMVVEVRSR